MSKNRTITLEQCKKIPESTDNIFHKIMSLAAKAKGIKNLGRQFERCNDKVFDKLSGKEKKRFRTMLKMREYQEAADTLKRLCDVSVDSNK